MSSYELIARFSLSLKNILLSTVEKRPQFFHLSTERNISFLQVVKIINRASMNTHVQVFVWTCFQLIWVNQGV
jgi:hypothetical protein